MGEMGGQEGFWEKLGRKFTEVEQGITGGFLVWNREGNFWVKVGGEGGKIGACGTEERRD